MRVNPLWIRRTIVLREPSAEVWPEVYKVGSFPQYTALYKFAHESEGTPVDEETKAKLIEIRDASKGATKPEQEFTFDAEGKDPDMLNRRGREIKELALALYPRPILLQGPTGMGKSVLARSLAKAVKQEYSAFNAHPGTDMSFLAGFWRPAPTASGAITIEWQNGLITDAAEKGHVLLFEEMSRAPQEAVSRLFGLLDEGFRYWPLPEKDSNGVEVHKDFWFIATSNPPDSGYRTADIDKALESRFAGVFDLTKPIADEARIIKGIVDEEIAVAIGRLCLALRKNKDTFIPTRDMVLLAQAIKGGMTPKKALEVSLLPKFRNHREAVMTIANDHEIWKK